MPRQGDLEASESQGTRAGGGRGTSPPVHARGGDGPQHAPQSPGQSRSPAAQPHPGSAATRHSRLRAADMSAPARPVCVPPGPNGSCSGPDSTSYVWHGAEAGAPDTDPSPGRPQYCLDLNYPRRRAQALKTQMAPLGGRRDIPDTFTRDPALRGWQPEQRRSEIEEPWSTYHNGLRLGQARLAPTRRACRPPRFPPPALLTSATAWTAPAGVMALRVHWQYPPRGPPAAAPGPGGPPDAQPRPRRPRPDAPRHHTSPPSPAPPSPPVRHTKTITAGPAAQPTASATATTAGCSARPAESRHPIRAGPAGARRWACPRLARAGSSRAFVTVPVPADLRSRA